MILWTPHFPLFLSIHSIMKGVKFLYEVMFSFLSVLIRSSLRVLQCSDPQVCQAVSWHVEMVSSGFICSLVENITTVVRYTEFQ